MWLRCNDLAGEVLINADTGTRIRRSDDGECNIIFPNGHMLCLTHSFDKMAKCVEAKVVPG